MADCMNLFLFGEEDPCLCSALRTQIISSRTDPYLRLFLNDAGAALRRVITKLSPSERRDIPKFSTIDELNNSSKGGQGHVGIQFALHCVYNVGRYISSNGGSNGDVEQQSRTKILGLSLGLLPAVAIALSPAIPTLINCGVDIVLLSFNLGLHIQQTACHLNSPTSSVESSSWSVQLCVDQQAAGTLLEEHVQSTLLINKLYISSFRSNKLTLSGPPTKLHQVVQSLDQSVLQPSNLPVYGPYHADHLYRDLDPLTVCLPGILGSSTEWQSRCLKFPMITPMGRFAPGTHATTLLSKICRHILNEKWLVRDVIEHCQEEFKLLPETCSEIVTHGSSDALASINEALKGSYRVVEVAERKHLDSPSQTSAGTKKRTSRNPKLAIVGMAGRFPNAASHQRFWDLLEGGIDLHRKVPKDRFDIEKHYDPSGKTRNTSHTPYGCFIDEPGLFDPRFFNMSPREATQTDPMHRLGLESAYEALEMAGYIPNRTPSTRLDRIGTFYGQTSDDWREINAAQDIDTYFITGGVRAFAPGRINYFFKFTGPSFSIDTACSSSAAAMQLACTSLWAGDCDTAVVGGLNVMTNSDIFSGLSRGQFLSKTGNCQTYDNDADGYCRGDGIGTIIIKRLEDAEADNDRVLGLILETETNHSANAISITHPHAETQKVLFQKVMDDAGIDPHEVNYVEMHGTGTQAGDGTEMESVTNVFAPPSRSGTREQPLHIGSVKANAGHGEAVSGVTAMIKCLLMLEKNLIPPHCGIKKTINQSFPQDLGARNVHIAFKPTPLVSTKGSPRRIFVNNFSAAGGNTGTLLEEAPQREEVASDPRGDWVVAVSAKSKSALQANTNNLIQHLREHQTTRLPDVSYTTTARRIQHNYRLAFVCQTLPEAIKLLSSKIESPIEPVSSIPPTIAFTYTGQGSHYTAVGKQLFELSSQFRHDLLMFNDIAVNLGFPSFLDLIKGSLDANELSPLVVQTGLTCIQIALTRLWASWGVRPSIVIGHSLGEYAALHASGVLSVSDTIYLVGSRARLLQERCVSGSHAMLATKSSVGAMQETLREYPGVEVACINGIQETVLGGTVHDINEVADKLTTEGTKCTKLRVQFAFHSPQIDPILDEFEQVTQHVTFNKPSTPIISPLLATVISEKDTIDGTYLVQHARKTVNFVGGLAAAQQLGCLNSQTAFVEIGPHPVSLNFVRSEFDAKVIALPSLQRNVAPFKSLSESLSTLHLSGVSVDWNEFHKDFVESVRVIDLPAYAFDNKNYWIQYTGDWNLHKGQMVGLAALPEPEVPKMSTTTVQKVLSEVVDVEKATIVIESDISRSDLYAAISGHVVNGTALCPSSIYADMAMTIGERLYRLLRPDAEQVHMNVCNMEVFKPLIANDQGGKGQTLRLMATADMINNQANLFFSSGSGKSEVQHAKCNVVYGSGEAWLAEWQRSAYLISGRIKSLQQAATSGSAHRMLRGMAYKLFGAFVEYNEKFRGMEEVILDSPELEATSSVVFQTSEADGKFLCSPYWIDSVCHLAGFIVNANDAVDSNKQVYVSHGWESMRFAEPLQADKTYRSYVKMQPLPGNMIAGDVYIFDGDRIVGMCGALKFQCIPRSLLNTFLPPKGAARSSDPKTMAPAVVTKAAAPKLQKVKVPKASSVKKATGPMIDKALNIIASEVGMPVVELASSIEFAAIGVDSLMSLSISSRMREELDIDCPSTVFADHPTVGDLRVFFKKFDTEPLEDPEDDEESSATPSSDYDSSAASDIDTPLSPPSSPGEPSDAESLSMIVRQVISEEMDVEMEELLATEDLSQIGMDSLMALSILGMLREKAGLALPSDFLVDNPSIKSIESALHINTAPKPTPKPKSKPQKSPELSPKIPPSPPAPTTPAPVARIKRAAPPNRQASSVLLQGSPKTAEKTLFLIPDGAGAPTSYVFMEPISPTVAVWGLTSPFLKTPEEFICGVSGIAAKFTAEIQRRQPTGPYHLGGWSAGGVISFEVCQQLMAQGHEVQTLILIDTPCPLIIEPLPGSLHRFFGSIGLLGDGDGALEKLPPWLLPHFAASVHALSTYDAVPLHPIDKCPRVWAMWCEDGVCKTPEDPRPDPYPYGHAQFLLENRTDFGPCLWDEFVDESKLVTRHMPGNHFSMMKAPYVKHLSDFMKEAMA